MVHPIFFVNKFSDISEALSPSDKTALKKQPEADIDDGSNIVEETLELKKEKDSSPNLENNGKNLPVTEISNPEISMQSNKDFTEVDTNLLKTKLSKSDENLEDRKNPLYQDKQSLFQDTCSTIYELGSDLYDWSLSQISDFWSNVWEKWSKISEKRKLQKEFSTVFK